jgi:ABC-type uncharacterized transport system substrate-binding protein
MTGANAAKSFTIGCLALLPGENRMSFMARFMRRLDELGYKNGQNLRLIYRSAEGQPQLLSGLASELVGMKPDVLVTGLGTVAARAGKTVSGGVPVVFMAVGDPVGANIVESLARPGGNVTGLSDLAAHIQGRRLALLREFAPAATIVAVVLNPGTPYTGTRLALQIRLPGEVILRRRLWRSLSVSGCATAMCVHVHASLVCCRNISWCPLPASILLWV